MTDIIGLCLSKYPKLVETHIDTLLQNAARIGDQSTFSWLINTYKDQIPTNHIGNALAEATSLTQDSQEKKEIIKLLIDNYPNLPGKDLESAIERSTLILNDIGLFKFYLDSFKNLQPKNLQKVLNNAFFVFGEHNKNVPTEYISHHKKIAELITKKFPDMKAYDQHGIYLKTSEPEKT